MAQSGSMKVYHRRITPSGLNAKQTDLALPIPSPRKDVTSSPSTPSSDPLADRRTQSKFWNTEVDFIDKRPDLDENNIVTPKTADLVDDAIRAGYTVDELLLTETMLKAQAKSVDSYKFSQRIRLRADKIVKSIVNLPKAGTKVSDRVTKQLGSLNPWKGPLPKKRISPPKTLGDAIITKDKRSNPTFSLDQRMLNQVLPETFDATESRTHEISVIGDEIGKTENRSVQELWPALPSGSAGTSSSDGLTRTESGLQGFEERAPADLHRQRKLIKSTGPSLPKKIFIPTIKGPTLFLMHTGLYRLRANVGSLPTKRTRSSVANPTEKQTQPPETTEQKLPSTKPTPTPQRFTPSYAQVASLPKAAQKGRMADRRSAGYGDGRGQFRGNRGGFDQGYGSRRLPRGRGRHYQPRYQASGAGSGQGYQEQKRETPNYAADREKQQFDNRAGSQHAGQHKTTETQPQQHRTDVDTTESKKRAAQPALEQNEPKQKKTTGEFCFRCYQPNHDKSVCTTELLCDICDAKSHLTARCPHNRGPKLIAQPVGFSVEGLGYHHIPYNPLPEPKKPSKMALVSVEGGMLDAGQVTEQLKRIMPGKWTWTAEPKGANTFLVPFPTQAELARAVAFGSADLKALGKKLVFEEYEEPADGDPMPLVWVKIFDLPKNIKVKPVLWAVGSMMGATMKVDMKTTLKNDYGRVQVAVLNPKKIPEQLSVAVGRRWYSVRVEIESIEAGSDDFIVDEDDMDADDMDLHEQDDMEQDPKPDEAEKTEKRDSTFGPKTVNTQSQNHGRTHDAATKENQNQYHGRTNDAATKEIAWCKEIIESAIDKVIDECAAKVAAEEDVIVEDVTEEDMMEEAGMETTQQGTRSSQRIQYSSAQDTLKKASTLKAVKNLDNDKGHLQSNVLDKILEYSAERGGAAIPKECVSQA